MSGKKRKAEEIEDKSSTGSDVPPLNRTRTMQETAKLADEFLKRVGHEVHTPLGKGTARETRSQHKIRSAVEVILGPDDKKATIPVDEVEQYKSQLKMVFRLIDFKGEGSIKSDQLVSVMRSLGKRPRQNKVQKILEEMDPEKTGKITLNSFVSFMLAKQNVVEEDSSSDEEEEPAKPKSKPKSPKVDKPKEKKEKKDRKGKAKADDDDSTDFPLPPPLGVLGKSTSILDFFNENAGLHEVAHGYGEVEKDLGKNNAFRSFSVLLANFNREAPLNKLFVLAHQALARKGFSVVEVDTEEELLDYLQNFDELWIASSDTLPKQSDKILQEIVKFHRSGKGIGIWAGGDPYQQEANLILKELKNVELHGSQKNEGDLALVGMGDVAEKPGTLARGLITTGLTKLSNSGISAKIKRVPGDAQVIGLSHHSTPAFLHWEGSSQVGRVFLNCTLVSSASTVDELSEEERFLCNIGVWLLGLEDRMKLGLRLAGDIQATADVVWEYYLERNQDGKKAGWHPYEEQAKNIVEAAYQKYIQSDQTANNIRAFTTVHSGAFTYEVDFKKMTQKNIAHENHKVRAIRRIG